MKELICFVAYDYIAKKVPGIYYSNDNCQETGKAPVSWQLSIAS
jgi:hypothetical protein